MTDAVFSLIADEELRQSETISLIPSENYCSVQVREAVGSVFSNKYSEGYPGRRYYEGNEIVDRLERLAQDRAKELFGVPHANVQPYSGSPANTAVQMALLEPGDTMLGFALAAGGHLTHGHPQITFGGKYFRSVQYGVREDGRIDMDVVEKLAKEHRPKVIYCGLTAYPFALDFERFGQIADDIGAFLVADIAHISGLVAARALPSPVPNAHIITTTTHKTLRGPRGAMILVTDKGLKKDSKLAEKIDKAVFPGLQGGPHNHTIAGITIALGEAMQPAFVNYAKQVLSNAKALAQALQEYGVQLVGGGTENHLMILDFRSFGGGTQVAMAMAAAGLIANKNTVPMDPYSAFYPSGVRVGTPAVTTLGMREEEMKIIARWIVMVAQEAGKTALPEEQGQRKAYINQLKQEYVEHPNLLEIADKVRELRRHFPSV